MLEESAEENIKMQTPTSNLNETQSQFKLDCWLWELMYFLMFVNWCYDDLFSISATSKEFYQLCCNPAIYKDEELNINLFMLPYLLKNHKYFDKFLSRVVLCLLQDMMKTMKIILQKFMELIGTKNCVN